MKGKNNGMDGHQLPASIALPPKTDAEKAAMLKIKDDGFNADRGGISFSSHSFHYLSDSFTESLGLSVLPAPAFASPVLTSLLSAALNLLTVLWQHRGVAHANQTLANSARIAAMTLSN